MKIGSKVLVTALVGPAYFDRTRRKLVRRPFRNPVEMYYTGYTFRCEGNYRDGGPPRNYFGSPDYEDEPPHLEVTRTVKVARVKVTERENDKFCLMEDLKEVPNAILPND